MILRSEPFQPGQDGEIYCAIPKGRRVARVDMDPATAARFTIVEPPRAIAREDMRELGVDGPGLRLRVRFEGREPQPFVAQIGLEVDTAPLQLSIERAVEDAWRRGGDSDETMAKAERDLRAFANGVRPKLLIGGGRRRAN